MAKEWDEMLDLLTTEELKVIHPDAPRDEGSAALAAGAFARIMEESMKVRKGDEAQAVMGRFIRAASTLPEEMIAAAIDRRLEARK